MSIPIITTKLHIPEAITGIIRRPSLNRCLDGALSEPTKYMLICAPAGSGKTTVASEWLRSLDIPRAWLSIDEQDNDPVRFWMHVIAGLQTIDTRIGSSLMETLNTLTLPAYDSIISTLVDDMISISRRMVMIFDDYHLITSESINNGVERLIDRLPSNMKFVIISRSEPALSLVRRKARGQVIQITYDDLRLSPDEIRFFINERFRLELTKQSVEVLSAKTEGWAAGIQLAALSMAHHTAPDSFIDSLAGDDRHIGEFLLLEVFSNQPRDIQQFLLKTSILHQFCESLCDFISENRNGLETINKLEKENLFIISLDSQKHWYRYHHLFGDFLKNQLFRIEDPDELLKLYRRACAWYEAERMPEEAVTSAVASRSRELAAEVLERNILTLFFRCNYTQLNTWLNSIGPEMLRKYPLLGAMYANIQAHMVSFNPKLLGSTRYWLDEALRGVDSDGSICRDRDLTRGFISLSYAYLALWQRDDPRVVIELALKALSGLPSADICGSIDECYLRLHSGLQCNLGMSYLKSGDIDKAVEAFEKAWQIGEACGDQLNAFTAVAYRCSILRRQGNLIDAASLCRKAIATIGAAKEVNRTVSTAPFSASVHILLASILLEWNELDAAVERLEIGDKLNRITNDAAVGLMAVLTEAEVLSSKGDLQSALDLLIRAETDFPESYGVIEAHRTRIYLLHLNTNPQFLDVLERYGVRHSIESPLDYESLTAVKVLIALRRVGSTTVRMHIQHSIEVSEEAGEVEQLLELLITDSMARIVDGDQPGALISLERSLNIALRGRYIRLFMNEGLPMYTLLSTLVGRCKRKGNGSLWTPAVEYASKLLLCFDSPQYNSASAAILFPRELEVLHLVADRASNAQIAQKLFISVNTVKKHLTNIFVKLGAENRQDAVEIARNLRLLR